MDSDLLYTWLIPYQRNGKNMPGRPIWIQTYSKKKDNELLYSRCSRIETKTKACRSKEVPKIQLAMYVWQLMKTGGGEEMFRWEFNCVYNPVEQVYSVNRHPKSEVLYLNLTKKTKQLSCSRFHSIINKLQQERLQ
jgi:hypothetical protein